MFSLEPRCQAARGSQKEDLDPSGDLQIPGPGPRSASFEYLGGNFNATVRTDGYAAALRDAAERLVTGS